MLYRDLIHFDPIESVIQLRSADEKQVAARLVETYVISERMADQLAHVIIPQLSLEGGIDHKGVLVVGNYGTGKSHLMSALSALAEHADLVPKVRNSEVRAAAAAIGGRFLVVRGEIGSVTRSLRDIVLDELSRFLAHVGTPYTFPPASQLSNNKEPLIQAMAGFSAQYPDKGVLFVLDELLDFLRSREERALMLDLGFLRELGEVTAATPFRFLAGVQETLFDNPRFQFVGEELRRVKDRFEQVRIAREDIAFVVAERMLRKSGEQRARVTEHLRRFVALYPQMADRLGEYAQLFPIHPAYIDVFERVYIAEKREVLQTFSRAIGGVLDQQVPNDQPGLISYDQYWDILRSNPALRTLPGVAEVVQKSDVLLGRVETGFEPKALKPYKPIAIRMIHALSVYRLTSELDVPLGLTVEELRDQLCLWLRQPESTADFLASTVKTAMDATLRVVNGQYISFNVENGQYYLDLKKDIDFDARIEERGNFIEERDLNGYFYAALQSPGLLNITTTSYVTNFRVWTYELPWQDHHVTRPGYLFLSSPLERSTAQPPRDFYLYFLPPFDAPGGRLEDHPDEVVFALEGVGSKLTELVRRYAGAQALANESPNHRPVYADKADQHRRKLVAWLRDHLTMYLRAIHRGKTSTVPQVLAQVRSSASPDPENLLRLIADHLLAPHFRDTYPLYPSFRRLTQPITESTRATAARDAVTFLARGTRTNLALGVLAGLGLLDENEKVRPSNSGYARYFQTLVEEKPGRQVVNRGEVLVQVAGGPSPVFKDPHFKLEPEWVAVVLLALAYDGAITLNLGNETLDASNLARAAIHGIEGLVDFRFYGRPQEMPLQHWREIFEALDLRPAMLQMEDEKSRDAAVRLLQAQVTGEVTQMAEVLAKVQHGVTVWAVPLFTDSLTYSVQGGEVTVLDQPPVMLSSAEMRPQVQRAKDFLEKLQTFNNYGKMRNLQLTSDELKKALAARESAQRVADVLKAFAALQPLTEYLGQALLLLPASAPWTAQAVALREGLLSEARRAMKGETRFDTSGWRTRLDQLRREYVETYAALHQQYVLGAEGDDQKARLLRDPRFERLHTLAGVDVLGTRDLDRWRDALLDLPACRDFHTQLLDATPECPRCHFHPAQVTGVVSAASRLHQLDEQLSLLLSQWESALRANLESETARASRRNMSVAERGPIDAYLASQPAEDASVPLPAHLVDAANQALRGLQMLRLDAADLLAALARGGFPCTETELRQRFDAYLSERMQGYDAHNTRLAIEQGDGDSIATAAGQSERIMAAETTGKAVQGER